MKTSYSWDCGANAEASISYSSGISITHHISAYKEKICNVGIFGDLLAREYTLYI